MRQKVYPELSGWLQGNNIGSCLLRVRIGNSWNPPSLQDYVTLRKVMIKLQYQRMHLFLREEEQFHLEALEKEAKETGRDLKECFQNDSAERNPERNVQHADWAVPQSWHGAAPGEKGVPSSGKEVFLWAVLPCHCNVTRMYPYSQTRDDAPWFPSGHVSSRLVPDTLVIVGSFLPFSSLTYDKSISVWSGIVSPRMIQWQQNSVNRGKLILL